MKRQNLAALTLPEPRTLDLTHVTPAAFAQALGNDPARIFAFVRNNIAFQAYAGVLRGPRGTLLALAGNSADRATLLAALLQQAGQQVRFARGRLSSDSAQALVLSMWHDPGPPAAEGEPSSDARTNADTIVRSITREYEAVRSRLRAAGIIKGSDAPLTTNDLVADAQDHYWVQWLSEGRWIDMDPSTVDASPGRALAHPDEVLSTLPDALYHTVTIRVWVEEQTGDSRARRELLAQTLQAADLSGTDVILGHMPEKWSGPADDPASAIRSVLEDTGRVIPILFVGDRWTTGQPFQQRIKTQGLGGVSVLLRGEGSRTAVALAIREWVEFEFVGPHGDRDTVVREIFDILGPAQRASGGALGAEQVQTKADEPDAFNVLDAVFVLFFTTGSVDAAHLDGIAPEAAGHAEEPQDVVTPLRRLGILFAVLSDGLLPSAQRRGGSSVVFYPASPRLSIAEFSGGSRRALRVVLDLRRTRLRAVGRDRDPELIFAARVLRGVAEGVVEHVLVNDTTRRSREDAGSGQLMSTLAVVDRARGDGVEFLLLPQDAPRLSGDIPPDGAARIREETSAGQLVIAPQRAVPIGGTLRVAWWRVDPRTGETVAATDEGLHQTSGEATVIRGKRRGEVQIVVRDYVGGTRTPNLAQPRVYTHNFRAGTDSFRQQVRWLLRNGYSVRSAL